MINDKKKKNPLDEKINPEEKMKKEDQFKNK